LNFGLVPDLTRRQRFVLAVSDSVFLRWVQPEGYSDYVPVYVVKCAKHGLFLDTPHGFNGYFQCGDCLAEAKMERVLSR
jgi:hypothetical protein